VGLVTLSEESYRVWCVCDREASVMRRPWHIRAVVLWKIKNVRIESGRCTVLNN
jgi:hypothetical protein